MFSFCETNPYNHNSYMGGISIPLLMHSTIDLRASLSLSKTYIPALSEPETHTYKEKKIHTLVKKPLHYPLKTFINGVSVNSRAPLRIHIWIFFLKNLSYFFHFQNFVKILKCHWHCTCSLHAKRAILGSGMSLKGKECFWCKQFSKFERGLW